MILWALDEREDESLVNSGCRGILLSRKFIQKLEHAHSRYNSDRSSFVSGIFLVHMLNRVGILTLLFNVDWKREPNLVDEAESSDPHLRGVLRIIVCLADAFLDQLAQ